MKKNIPVFAILFFFSCSLPFLGGGGASGSGRTLATGSACAWEAENWASTTPVIPQSGSVDGVRFEGHSAASYAKTLHIGNDSAASVNDFGQEVVYQIALPQEIRSAVLRVSYADNVGGNVFQVSIDGVEKGTFATVTNCGSDWNTYTWYDAVQAGDLAEGVHEVRLRLTVGGSYGVNLDRMELVGGPIDPALEEYPVEFRKGFGEFYLEGEQWTSASPLNTKNPSYSGVNGMRNESHSRANGFQTLHMGNDSSASYNDAGQWAEYVFTVDQDQAMLSAGFEFRYSDDAAGNTVDVYLDGALKGRIATKDCSDQNWNTFVWSGEIIGLGNLAAGSSHTIKLVLTKGGSWGVNIDQLGIYAKGYSSSAARVYVADLDAQSIWVINGISGTKINTVRFPTGASIYAPQGFAFVPGSSSNPRYFVTDQMNKRIYDFEGDALKNTLQRAETGISAISVDPTGNFAYINADGGGLVLDCPADRIENTTNARLGYYFTPDRTRAYSIIDGNYGSISQVWVTETLTHSSALVVQLPPGTAPQGAGITPDGTRLYVTGWLTRNVSVIDIDPASPTYHTVIAVIPASGQARSIAIRPSGDFAYVAYDSGGLGVLDIDAASPAYHTIVASIAGAGSFGGVHSVVSSPDGSYMYLSGNQGGSDANKLYVVNSDPSSPSFNTLAKTFIAGTKPYVFAAIAVTK